MCNMNNQWMFCFHFSGKSDEFSDSKKVLDLCFQIRNVNFSFQLFVRAIRLSCFL